jgi:AAA domain
MAVRRQRTNAPARKAAPAFTLPTEVSEPGANLSDYTILLYGERGIGKTTLAREFPNPYFLMFEPGARGIAVKKTEVRSWEQFLDIVDALEANPEYCDTLIIDTGYMAYERCFAWCLEDMGVSDPKEKSFGTVWKFIEKEFRNAMIRLEDLGVGLIVVAHSKIKEIKDKDGNAYDKLSIQLGGQAFSYFAGCLNNVWYYHYMQGGKRFLQIRGDELIEAKTQCEGHFMYGGTDTPIITLDMGKASKESYTNLCAAFNNEQERGIPKQAVRRRRR